METMTVKEVIEELSKCPPNMEFNVRLVIDKTYPCFVKVSDINFVGDCFNLIGEIQMEE